MKLGENMAIKRKVNAFRIWRLATSVGWDCSAVELAKELGLTAGTVRIICKQKGWELQDGRYSSEVRFGVDRLMKS